MKLKSWRDSRILDPTHFSNSYLKNHSEIFELTNSLVSLCCLSCSHTSEIAFGDFTNFLPSIPQVQNIQEGSQHQVLNRATGMQKILVGTSGGGHNLPPIYLNSVNLPKFGWDHSPRLYTFRRPQQQILQSISSEKQVVKQNQCIFSPKVP